MITIDNVTKSYNSKVLDNISIKFKSSGFYVILGDSGSGKSTLLNIISGIDNNYDGKVIIDNINLKKISEKERKKIRLFIIGYIFQDFKLLNLLTVKDNINFNFDSISKISSYKKDSMVKKIIKFVNLKNKKNIAVNKLSGGERQRVAIARAIISDPKYLLCDEPTGNLDYENSIEIYKILKEYSKNHLVIVVSHDKENIVKFADKVIEIKDGKILSETKINEINEDNRRLNIIKKKFSFFSILFLLKLGYSKIKEKRIRSSFTNVITSISLVAFGLSILISNELNTNIVNAFSSVINQNQLIVSKKSNNPNLYTSTISSPYEEVINIYKDYSDYLLGVGVSYLTNLNNIFISKDDLSFINGDNRIILSSFHSSLFSNYIWKEEKYNTKFYPEVSYELKRDEIILGLTYEDLVNICLELKIERSFDALGAYLIDHELMVRLDTDNDDWQYSKQTYFFVKSIYPSLNSEICHTSHAFNEFLFENELSLLTTFEIDYEPDVPWTLKKVYSLHSYEYPGDLIKLINLNNKYNDVILEREFNEETNDYRYVTYVFDIDKNAVNISDILNFNEEVKDIDSYYFTTQEGLMMHSSGMLEGFNNDIAFTFSEEKAYQIGDYFSKYEEKMEKFEGAAIGGLKVSSNESVKFSSSFKNLIKGNIPINNDEIVVSNGLINYLGFKDDPLYEDFYYSYYLESKDEVLVNKFKIVGIVNEDKNYIYHNPFFSISFFRDNLNISSFNLIPSSIIIQLKDGSNIKEDKAKLENAYKGYEIKSPLLEISKTVDDVMKYVSVVAKAFSYISFIISIFLLVLISYLNAIESKNEIKLLNTFGHNNLSILTYTLSHSLIMSIIATIISLFEMLFIEFICSFSINSMFGLSSISFNLYPFIIIIILGLTAPILVSLIVNLVFLIKNKFR